MRLETGAVRRRSEPASQEAVRRQNVASLLRLLHERGPLTRSELTAATGLNRSTTGALTTELAALGLVREGSGGIRPGVMEVRGKGRPSLVVEPVVGRVQALVFDVTTTGVNAAAVGLGALVLQIRRRLFDRDPQDVGGVVEMIVGLAEFMLERMKQPASCLALVVSVPGSVRQPDGLVRRAPSLGWSEVPLARLVADAMAARSGLTAPVLIGNDGDLGAIGEHLRGAARHHDEVLYVRGETGVAGGIIVDAQLLGGAELAFAELLHDPVGTMRILGGSAHGPVASSDVRAASSQ